ncbi:MAG: stalk domain-containing protein [Bacillota bacterium]
MTLEIKTSLVKRFAAFFIATAILIAPIQGEATGAALKDYNVSYSGGTKSVSVIWADLNDKRVRVETVLAKGAVGETDTLVNIVNSASDSDGKAVAGINGSFFEAYTDFQPSGTLISDGQIRHVSNTGSMFIVDAHGKARVDSLYIGVQGGVNNQWEWPNNWYAWNINHFYTDPAAVMVFDSNYKGPRPPHSFTSIQVDNGIVRSIGNGGFNIPQEGFLLLTNDQNMVGKFKVGSPADFRYGIYENDYITKPHTGREVDISNVRTATGAGPTLVNNGQIVADPALEGFTEDKILNNRARRSFIGVTSDGKLGFGSVDGVNINELAEIAKALGMIDAVNLDGGASSGTVYNGNNVVREGRLLSNAIVIKYMNNEPISVNLNKSPIIFDTDPFIDATNSRTLVPLRGIAESLGANVGWDQATSSVLIYRHGTNLRLKVGSPDVFVNGDKKTMDASVVLRNSRTYVPVRFITEFFGGEVGWDGITKTVELQISRSSDTM